MADGKVDRAAIMAAQFIVDIDASLGRTTEPWVCDLAAMEARHWR